MKGASGPATLMAAGITIALLSSGAPASVEIDRAGEDTRSIVGEAQDDQFGFRMAVGDMDADDQQEFFVSAPGLADQNGIPNTGLVYIIGVTDAAAATDAARITELPHGALSGRDARSRFGSSLVVADFDGDGFDDLAVGAPYAGGEVVAAGATSVWFGGADRTWTDRTADRGPSPYVTLRDPSAGARFGLTMMAADLDSDGAAELVVSAPNGGTPSDTAQPGAVYILTGEALRACGPDAFVADVATTTVFGASPGDSPAGLCALASGAHRTPELLVGSYRSDSQAEDGGAGVSTDVGRVDAVRADSLLSHEVTILPWTAGWSITGPTARSSFGRSMTSGDVDGDGVEDLLVSAYTSRAGRKKLTAAGEVFLIFGEPEDPGTAPFFGDLDDPDVLRLRGRSGSDVLGYSVLLGGLAGSGIDNVFVSARYSDGPDGKRRDCGEVYVFRGSLRSVVAAKFADIDQADLVVVGAKPDDAIGESMLLLDIDGDGERELLVGAPDLTRPDSNGERTARCGGVFIVPGSLLRR
jgi:hypothetical protein